jgi:hypothetical protein
MRSFFKSPYRYLFYLLIITAISLSIVYFLSTDKTTAGNCVEISFLTYIATAALGVIAYFEFHRAHQLNTNELLTFISNRWSSSEIIKARQIIHEIFVFKYRYDTKGNPQKDFIIAIRNTSNDVYEMSKEIKDKGQNFIYLLNLLDHFESVSYLSISNQINLDDVKNIYGNNMIFYYETFEIYIKQRQSHNPADFLNYSKMYGTLKPKNITE